MAQRLMQSGFDLVVFDTDDAATSQFEGTSASVSKSLDHLVMESGIICLCLPGPDLQRGRRGRSIAESTLGDHGRRRARSGGPGPRGGG
mgnify:CR=1 FL=1